MATKKTKEELEIERIEEEEKKKKEKSKKRGLIAWLGLDSIANDLKVSEYLDFLEFYGNKKS